MRKTSSSRGRFPIASHPIFKPALIGWAALVVALVILILPEQLIARFALLTGLSILGDNARYILAVIGGIIGGGIGFALAALVKSSLTRNKAEVADDAETDAQTEFSINEDGDIQPIDPAAELGSASLDAPIEHAQFEEIAGSQELGTEPDSDTVPVEHPIPAEGRRRSLAQIARSEQAPETPDLIIPNYGADENAAETQVQAETYSQPEQDTDVSDTTEQPAEPSKKEAENREPGPWMRSDYDEEATQEAEFDNAETVSAEDTSDERKITLPDAAGAQSALDALIQSSGATSEHEIPSAIEEADGEPESSAPPRSLDLDEFAALPGRNAVWVQETTDGQTEEPKLEPVPEPATPQTSRSSSANAGISTALAKLRATPIEELNMVQMIERLAAALEDRKSAIQSNPGTITDPARKHALAEGLKTLSAVANGHKPEIAHLDGNSISENDVEQESEKLRDALDKLADLRGAA